MMMINLNLSKSQPDQSAGIGPLSELDAGLAGENAEQVREDALGRLAELELSLRSTLNKGVSSAEYPNYAALLEACEASRGVLKMAVRRTP